MKKTNNLENLKELLKEDKPKVRNKKTVVTTAQVTKDKIINIHKGLKIFR